MTPPHKIFADSDVVISSLLSTKGAAHFLIHKTTLTLFISNISYNEMQIVSQRLKMNKVNLKNLVRKKFKVIKLTETTNAIKGKYIRYTTGLGDAHIVAAATAAKVKFLLSYNIKHFKVDKIKKDLGIIILTPAHFLQHLRSLDGFTTDVMGQKEN